MGASRFRSRASQLSCKIRASHAAPRASGSAHVDDSNNDATVSMTTSPTSACAVGTVVSGVIPNARKALTALPAPRARCCILLYRLDERRCSAVGRPVMHSSLLGSEKRGLWSRRDSRPRLTVSLKISEDFIIGQLACIPDSSSHSQSSTSPPTNQSRYRRTRDRSPGVRSGISNRPPECALPRYPSSAPPGGVPSPGG